MSRKFLVSKAWQPLRSVATAPPTISRARDIAKGSGGRSSVSGIVATVFGCTGFIGHYAVNQLGRIGSQVICPWRGDELEHRRLKVMGDLGQIIPTEFELRDRDSVRNCCKTSNVVVNLIGKHYGTINYSLEESTVESARIVAETAAELGIEHFIHITHANASENSNSELLRAKAKAEKIVRDLIPTATIIRCTDVFGSEDRFLNRIMFLRESIPFYPILAFGKHEIQPVYVLDVANVVAMAARDFEGYAGKTFKLAGSERLSMKSAVDWVMKVTGANNGYLELSMPKPLINVVNKVLSRRFPFINPKPIIGSNDAEEEARDNVLGTLQPDELSFEDIDYVPHPLRSSLGKESLLVHMHRKTIRSRLYVDD
eukprot:Plantae.Rhodophyta-Purpureofilum_apyrenoidigerum.ctg2677.p1 GENE.Plantae.Rhodophyta-Purpureofilum_apyrenoidigerum.ctg2677~~Plantae.Rhodophyta-Purpureofilum_apyrenoidigerum.ctg2677.p1  ORF type:complete len:371 (+),score=58.00 Plantae.Rhodophyta-Purpureofilum_apyrenoidigerum.ctg2677:150-1262(+)